MTVFPADKRRSIYRHRLIAGTVRNINPLWSDLPYYRWPVPPDVSRCSQLHM